MRGLFRHSAWMVVVVLCATAHAQPPAGTDRPPGCAGDAPFSYGDLSGVLPGATAWACTRRNHIVALLPVRGRSSLHIPGTVVTTISQGPVAWTDDRGQTWHRPPWSSPQLPRAMAFDERSGFGLLVGDNGAIWSSHDGGETFTDHGTSPPAAFTSVLILENIGVAMDDRGDAYVLRADGFERELIAHAPGGWIERERNTILLIRGSEQWRIRADGSIDH